ncbi:MAG: methyltransferase domain-containing protein [Nitriliruptorales bacterium]|nr:methyltransferase domain-containing protein [Nitriliruptorales bacterium]
MTDVKLREHRALWGRKPALRGVYTDCYQRMVAACRSGRTLELGGGPGNFKTFAGTKDLDVVSTDIVFTPWLDAVCDGHYLPFVDGAFDNIVMFDVLHHLAKPRLFFAEAQRVLKPGGRLVMVEPAITAGSRLFYTFLHPEPVRMAEDPLATGPPDPDRDPFDSNQAFPTLLFRRQRRRFEAAFPALGIRAVRWFSFLAYPLSGGFRPWSLVPARLVDPLLRLEAAIEPYLGRLLGFRMITVLERRPVADEADRCDPGPQERAG